jgi:uncharacterized protein (TIGR03790 family)
LRRVRHWLILTALIGAPAAECSQSSSVVVIVNGRSAASRQVAGHYARRRGIPPQNVCPIATTEAEEISRATYEREIARPLMDCLRH